MSGRTAGSTTFARRASLVSASLIKPVMNRTTPVMDSVMPALNSLTPVNEPITSVRVRVGDPKSLILSDCPPPRTRSAVRRRNKRCMGAGARLHLGNVSYPALHSVHCKTELWPTQLLGPELRLPFIRQLPKPSTTPAVARSIGANPAGLIHPIKGWIE